MNTPKKNKLKSSHSLIYSKRDIKDNKDSLNFNDSFSKELNLGQNLKQETKNTIISTAANEDDEKTAKLDYKNKRIFDMVKVQLKALTTTVWFSSLEEYLNINKESLNNFTAKAFKINDYSINYLSNNDVYIKKEKGKFVLTNLYSMTYKDINSQYETFNQSVTDKFDLMKQNDSFSINKQTFTCFGHFMNQKIVIVTTNPSLIRKIPDTSTVFNLLKKLMINFTDQYSSDNLIKYIFSIPSISEKFKSLTKLKSVLLQYTQNDIALSHNILSFLDNKNKMSYSNTNTYTYLNKTANTSKDECRTIEQCSISNINNNYNITLIKNDKSKNIHVVMHKQTLEESIDCSSAGSSIISRKKYKPKINHLKLSNVKDEILIDDTFIPTALTPIKKTNVRYFN